MTKQNKILIGVGVAALIAFLTRKYWIPYSAKISIKKVDWNTKSFSYSLNLQGEDYKGRKVDFTPPFQKEINDRFNVSGRKFLVTGGVLNDNMFSITIYKGYLEGVPTSQYSDLTIDSVIIDFKNKKVYRAK